MLRVDEESSECDIAASKKVCPRLSKLKLIVRVRQKQNLTNLELLDLAIRWAWYHGEIYRSSKDPERQSKLSKSLVSFLLVAFSVTLAADTS